MANRLLAALAVTSILTVGLVAIYFAMSQGDNKPQQRPYEPKTPAVFDDPIPIADFQLTDQQNRPFRFSDLQGNIVVADFFFTTCKSFCPMMSLELSKLQKELKASGKWQHVRFMSTSVDPETDTPEALRAYAQRFDADLFRWTFLTGSRDEITRIAREQFLLEASNQKSADTDHLILHSSKFVLIDPQGRIRGYYDTLIPEEMQSLRADLDLLLMEYAETWKNP